MKLSILIPMYNAESYMDRCLNSILSQDLHEEDYEIIVMDDGSTDNCKSIVESFQKKHSNIRLYSKENEGESATRNKLFKHAKGDYLYCMDADDYVMPDTLSEVLERAISAKVDILAFEASVTSDSHEEIIKQETQVIEASIPMKGIDFFIKYPEHRVEVWWYFIRNDFRKEEDIWFGNRGFNEDVLFTIKAFIKARRVVYFPMSVYRYFQSPNSVMRDTNKEKKARMIYNFHSMIVDVSNYLNHLSKNAVEEYQGVLKNLSRRRDTFLFFLILKMVRAEMSKSQMQQNINMLRSVGAYPIKNKIYSGDYSMKYAVLNYLVNREHLLYSAASAYRVFKRN